MLVPKFVCEVSKVSVFAWFMGGDGDTSLDKRHDVAIRPYCTSREGIQEHTCVLLKIDGDMKGKFRFSTKAVEIGIDRKTIKRNISYLILRGEQEKC